MAYLLFRNERVAVAGVGYSGFVTVIAVFLRIILIAKGALWYLTGRVARIQSATVLMVLVFGGLSVWLNDPRFSKMKPTSIYLALALILGIGAFARPIVAQVYHGGHDPAQGQRMDDTHQTGAGAVYALCCGQ